MSNGRATVKRSRVVCVKEKSRKFAHLQEVGHGQFLSSDEEVTVVTDYGINC
jgi:hypothetical protein